MKYDFVDLSEFSLVVTIICSIPDTVIFQVHIMSWGLIIFYVCRRGNSYQDKQWWKFLKTG